MKIVLLGPSGAGKGSISELVKRDFEIPHISSGSLFREHVANRTALGIEVEDYVNSGHFVPDDLTFQMIMERIEQSDCISGFLLDGFPRTLRQAELLADFVNMDYVFDLRISDDIVAKRLSGRFMCSACNAIHNKMTSDLTACRVCGGAEFYQREDDTEAVIRLRLKQYHDNIKGILDFYSSHGILHTIDIQLEDRPKEIFARICDIIRTQQ